MFKKEDDKVTRIEGLPSTMVEDYGRSALTAKVTALSAQIKALQRERNAAARALKTVSMFAPK